MLYKNSNRPLYQQLKDILIEEIESGKVLPGEAILSERKLAEVYEISRVTVRQSVELLVNLGYLIRSQGSETIVADRKVNMRVGPLLGIIEELCLEEKIARKKITIHPVFRGFDIDDPMILDMLRTGSEKVYEFDRLVLVDEKPCVYNKSYVAKSVGSIVDSLELSKDKVFSHLEKCGYDISYAEQTFSAEIAQEHESRYLQCQIGAPVLVAWRTTFLSDRSPIMIEKSVFRSDMYQLTLKSVRRGQILP